MEGPSDHPQQSDSGESWLLRVRSEGESAFNELYAEVAPALFAWARVRIRAGRGVHLDPSDLVQEVWCRAWRGLEDLAEDIPLRPWLFRIAKNVLPMLHQFPPRNVVIAQIVQIIGKRIITLEHHFINRVTAVHWVPV